MKHLNLCLLVGLLAGSFLPHALAEAEPVASAPTTAAAPSSAPAQSRRILVMAVEASHVPPTAAQAVEDELAHNIGQRAGISVATSAELKQTVKAVEQGQELGCTASEQCLVEVRKKLQAEEVVTAKLSKYDDGLMLALRLIDARDQTVRQHVTRIADDLAAIKLGLDDAISELLGTAAIKPRFTLPKDAQQKLAVMPLKALGVRPETAENLTQVMSQELSEMGFQVLGRDDIEAMLKASADGAQLGCTDALECVVKIAANYSASNLLFGSVGKAGGLYVVSLKLVDVELGEVRNRALQSFDGDEAELGNALRIAGYDLVGAEYQQRKGGVDLTFNVTEAPASVGPTKAAVADSRLRAANLAPGCHTLRVNADADDYFPFQTDLCVIPDRTDVRTLTVIERPTPWYATWWFWTTVGVVVAGSTVATAAVLTDKSPSDGSGMVVVP